jgi:hypothetical protein
VLARIRPRLTYANVVATIALFVALGGSSFAAVKLTSGDIKNRSIKRVDLKKNTLTGKEIREARLRTVPRARSADSAQNAFTATNSQNADLAKNSETLAGQAPGVFERSSRMQFGSAATSPAPPAGQEPSVVSWPELGVSVAAADPAGCGSGPNLALVSTRGSGHPQLVVYDDGGATVLDPGERDYVCPGEDDASLEITEREHPNRSFFVQCFGSGNGESELKCLAVRSEP